MAEAFEDFDDYSTGVLTGPWEDTWGSYNIQEVVAVPSDNLAEQSAGLGAQALRLNSHASSSNRRATKYTDLSGSAEDEIFAVVGGSEAASRTIPTLHLRGGGTTEATRNGYILFIRSGSNNFGIRRKLNGSNNTRVSGTFADGWWSDAALVVRFKATESGASVILQAKVWRLGIDDEADAVTINNTDTTPPAHGWLGIGHINVGTETKGFFGSVGFGTDGDPAPTGPLDVSAEPFQLRHNPRTNKVIPVLSSPTVTDIGAACVRPRVTKGY